MRKEKLRKSDLKPGDKLRNIRSGFVGEVLASPKDPAKLHEQANQDYVRVLAGSKSKKGPREVAWSLENLVKV